MNRRALLVLGALFSFAFVVILGCGSGGSGPTAPPGGGGPTFDLRFPENGASRSFTFPTAGTWGYHCEAHQASGMTGVVVVDASSVEDSAFVSVGPGNSRTYSPTPVTIKPGGTVRWENVSSRTDHTVTRP